MQGWWRTLLDALTQPDETPEQRSACQAATQAFEAEHPSEPVAWTSLRADEADRFIVGVYYGSTRPPHYLFYEVRKTTGAATPLTDDTAYRPKVWR